MRERRDENCVDAKGAYEGLHTCVICGKDYAGHGNNAEPLASGRCCDDCNRKVIAERIRRSLSGMEKFALEVGKKYIETKYVLDDYTFDYRGTDILRRDVNGGIDYHSPYLTFEEWIESLSPKCFSQDLMFELFEAGIGSFTDFIDYVKDALKEKYNLKLTDTEDRVTKAKIKE